MDLKQRLSTLEKSVLEIAALHMKLAAQCVDLAIEMTEAGHADKVRPMVAKLQALSVAVASGERAQIRESIVSFMGEMEILQIFCRRKAAEVMKWPGAI